MRQGVGLRGYRGYVWSHKTTENQRDMMTANEEGRCLKHDTAMCGDPKVWFPMNTDNPHRELVPAGWLKEIE